MLILTLSDAEKQVLIYERFVNHRAKVQKRMEVILLHSTSRFSNQEIAQLVGIHRDTVTDWVKLYQQAGLEALKTFHYVSKPSSLDMHQSTLQAYFQQHPPKNSAQAKAVIEEKTAIVRSPTQVRAWMKKIGMKFGKVGQIPAKADANKQKQWLDTTLQTALHLAQQQKAALLFMDAAHCVMGVFLCCLWSFSRLFVKSSAGRKRLNILGAVNALTRQVTFLTNATRINAYTIMEFLLLLRQTYQQQPIYIVLDNARYQHCQKFKDLAVSLNIHLLFLPPYSPNLNIIERLWKWLKKKCLYATYYESFEEFSDAICQTLNDANTKHKTELKSLLTLSFQRFQNAEFLTV